MEAAAFLAAYADAWRRRDPDAFSQLLAPDGVMRQPDSPEPLTRATIRDYTAAMFAAAPDLELTIVRTAQADDGAVLVEWSVRATAGGQPIARAGVDRFVLGPEGVRTGVGYFDPRPSERAMEEMPPP